MLRTSFLFFLLLTVGIVAQEGDYGDYPDYQDYAVDDYGPVQDDYGVPQDTLYHDYAQRQNTKDGYVSLRVMRFKVCCVLCMFGASLPSYTHSHILVVL
jgi:hypothetical protein